MKENSIEEDIKLLEEFSNENVLYGFTVGMTLEKYKNLQFSTEHILSDYKRVLKENEELKNNIRKNENELEFDVDCDWIALQKILDESEKSNEYILYKNEKWIKEKYCISVQKVKDKIEHYQKLQDSYIEKYDKISKGLQAMISALQELLEGEELGWKK